MLNVLLQNESVATAGASVRLRKASVLRLVVPSGVKCSRRPKPCERPALCCPRDCERIETLRRFDRTHGGSDAD
ncbi:hypothetical protein SNK19_20475 [Ralstonia pseudosolanacearum]|uniref:hypothetical protein n=1 Tax=Ralstonia pseudosolanacearum TaxID=1310165 RepID=UPI0007D805C0|nr:hypothetical protein [Ralstonia pseudosolanacearum]MDC6293661.1 hypothetical protein [Ralstonia pseudosolanacearum]MDD7791529.1 hypothetical protein [Ralstonia pseudosolanacearum]OAK92636.1 hypothetical protein AB851_03370 [Ralstonia pseudosolanacearum]